VRPVGLLALLMLMIAALLTPPAGAAAKTVDITITCSASGSVNVGTFVAAGDSLRIDPGNVSCNTFTVTTAAFATGDSFKITGTSSRALLGNRDASVALNVNGAVLATVTNGAVNVEIRQAEAPSPPQTPTSLAVTAGNGQVSIAFTQPGDGAVDDYEYSLDGADWVSSGRTASPITISGLTNGTTYSIAIRARNAVGTSAESPAVSATPEAPPATEPPAPTGLSATPGDGQASVTFTQANDGGSAITNYEYSVNDGGWTARSPASTASPITVAGLKNGTEYSIRIRAVNGIGPGTQSASVAVTPLPPTVQRVTLCHRTSAVTNPYRLITVSVSSVFGARGHGSHTGAPFDPDFAYPPNARVWGDIIPPFAYSDGGVVKFYAGMNWGSDWQVPAPLGVELSTANIQAAVPGTDSPERSALATCIDLTAATPSVQAKAIETPPLFYKVMVENGAPPEDVVADLNEQEAVTGAEDEPESPVTVDALETILEEDKTITFTPRAVTEPASQLRGNSGKVMGKLKTTGAPSWADCEFEIVDADEQPVTTKRFDCPPNGTSEYQDVEADVTGLECESDYSFRVRGKSGGSPFVGRFRTFTTDSCSTPGSPPVTPPPGPTTSSGPGPSGPGPGSGPPSAPPTSSPGNPNRPINPGGGVVRNPRVTSLTPGQQLLLIDDEPVETTKTINEDDDTVTISGEDFVVTVGPRPPTGSSRPLGDGGAPVVDPGDDLEVTGEGYDPGSEIEVFLVDPPQPLGRISVDENGRFRGAVPIPTSLPPGAYVVQLNGLTPELRVRSLSLGLTVEASATVTTTCDAHWSRKTIRVYFASMSPAISPQANRALTTFARSLRGKKDLQVDVRGFVQPVGVTRNDLSLSAARARNVTNRLRTLGVTVPGANVRAEGRAQQSGATARRVEVVVRYRGCATKPVAQVPTRKVALPTEFRIGGTRLLPRSLTTNAGQVITPRVQCVPNDRMAVAGGKAAHCSLVRVRDWYVLEIASARPLSIAVTLTAPATKGYRAYRSVQRYQFSL
jgi:outer membrane protein OmpA-like peptidoglycan-associated protein